MMQALPAASGWQWMAKGLMLLRKQPIELCSLLFACLFFFLALTLLPLVGIILVFLLLPVLPLAFVQACEDIEHGKRVYPTALLTAFRSPNFPRLLMLGLVQFALMTGSLALVMAFDDTLLNLLRSQMQTTVVQVKTDELFKAATPAFAMWYLIDILLWFAPPLIHYRSLPLGKSLFFSVFGLFKAGRAFLSYMFAWCALTLLTALLTSALAAVMGATVAEVATLPLAAIFQVYKACCLHPAFSEVFGAPTASGRSGGQGSDELI